MTINELKENLINYRSEMESLINAGEAEKRELTDEENAKLAELRKSIDDAQAQIDAMNAENEKLANEQRNNKENKSNKTMKEVRLIDLINGVVEGRQMEEAEAKYMSNATTINTRAAIVAGTATQGQENVPEDKMNLDVAIRNASVLNKLGATWFGNAVGDISIPKYAGSNVAWKGEVVEAEDGAGAFSETLLQPKRLTAYVDVSKQFLAQDSNDAESILIKDLADAIAEKFDKTVFGVAEGTANQPAGIFYNADTVALNDMDYDSVLGLEEGVELKNGTNFIFVTNPKAKYHLKGEQMANGLQMVYNGGEIDGVKTIVSNSVEGIACMDPRDLAVATWGGVEITVDTTSRAIYGEVRLVVNFYCDAKLRGDRVAVLQISD